MAAISLGQSRACSKCGDEKPWTIDFFRSYVVSGGRCTLRLKCRKCEGYLSEGSSRITRRGPLSEDERREAKIQANRRFFEKDPERARRIWREGAARNRDQRRLASKRTWANRDPELTRAKYARWKAENADHVREYNREYCAGWRERNPEKHREAVRKWRAENPQAALVQSAKWRARKAGAQGSHTLADIENIYSKQKGRCFYCGDSLRGFHVDHFIPLAKGGSDFPSNLRIACPPCNCRKSDKMPWEWKPDRFAVP